MPTKARGRQEAMEFAPPQPGWLFRAPPPPPATVTRITPSTVRGASHPVAARSVPSGLDAARAAERGRLIHRLLQSLPDLPMTERRERARHYLDAIAAHWPEGERTALLEATLGVLDHPDFAPVFGAGSRAEVEIAGRIGTAALSGRIDRLAVTDDRVLIVDYKTNRPAPATVADVPHEYVMQLALYRAILGRLYPDRPVAAAILWTEAPALMEIPAVLLDLAELEATPAPR